MSLNIKSERVHDLVRELASRTGMSQTSAVEDAVRRRLEELEDEKEARVLQRYEAIGRIAAEIRASLSEEEIERMRHSEDWLYDERGLPA